MGNVVGLTEQGKIHRLGRGEIGLEGWAHLSDGQQLKNPTPLVVDEENGQGSLQVRAKPQAAAVVQKGQIPG